MFKDKRKVETVTENRYWCQGRQKMAVFLGKGSRQYQELFQNYNHFRARHCRVRRAHRGLLMSALVQYIRTGAISVPYSQLAIIPLTQELQFLHWKRSDRPIWYWFFRQPHTVSCFGVQGDSTICWNSEERKENWLFQSLPSPSADSIVMIAGVVIP